MTLFELLTKLQKEFKQKIVTGQIYDRGFEVDFSLDNKIKVGKGLLWHTIKDLSLDGYAVVLYKSDNFDGEKIVKATPMDETNAFKITESPNPEIQTGPISYRDLGELTLDYHVIISGTKELDFYARRKKKN
nr:hypothetical protein [Nanoarchaeota archaeon]